MNTQKSNLCAYEHFGRPPYCSTGSACSNSSTVVCSNGVTHSAKFRSHNNNRQHARQLHDAGCLEMSLSLSSMVLSATKNGKCKTRVTNTLFHIMRVAETPSIVKDICRCTLNGEVWQLEYTVGQYYWQFTTVELTTSRQYVTLTSILQRISSHNKLILHWQDYDFKSSIYIQENCRSARQCPVYHNHSNIYIPLIMLRKTYTNYYLYMSWTYYNLERIS